MTENQTPKTDGNSFPKDKKKYYRPRRRVDTPQKKENRRENTNYEAKLSFNWLKKISVIVPLFNEEESLNPLYFEIKKGLAKLACTYELIFVDDGSSDNSLNEIKRLAKLDPRIKYFSFRKNYGKSTALNVGFENCEGDAVITLDADLQDDPNEISNLVAKLNEGWDLVSGWKKKRFDPLIKRQSSKFFNYMTRLTSNVKIHDFNCGLKAYKKEVVKNLYIHGELHRYIPVLAAEKGYKVTEIIVKHQARRYGKTKFGISRFFYGFVDLLTIQLITKYASRPLHLFGMIGSFSFIIGFGIEAILTWRWLFENMSLSNRPLLLLGLLLMIVGVQLFAIGLLGELFVHKFGNQHIVEIKEQK